MSMDLKGGSTVPGFYLNQADRFSLQLAMNLFTTMDSKSEGPTLELANKPK